MTDTASGSIDAAQPAPRIASDDEIKDLVMTATISRCYEDYGTFFLTQKVPKSYKLAFQRAFDGSIAFPETALAFVNTPAVLLPVGREMVMVLTAVDTEAPVLLTSIDNWKTVKTILHGQQGYFQALNKNIREESPYMEYNNRLQKVRSHEQTVFDFTLVCNDDKEIKVHSQVLASQWPFFDKMLESNMAEKSSHTLKLPHSKRLVEAIVSHLYDEQMSMSFEVAAGLLVTAQMYDLPKLLITAMQVIKNTALTYDKALLAWKKANEADNKAVKKHCARYLHSNIGGLGEDDSEAEKMLAEFDRAEMIQLFKDMSLVQVAPAAADAAVPKRK